MSVNEFADYAIGICSLTVIGLGICKLAYDAGERARGSKEAEDTASRPTNNAQLIEAHKPPK